jgi:hypothetical protein
MAINIEELWIEHEMVFEYCDYVVGVDKVGGGTPWKGYTGDWHTTVYDVTGAELEKVPVHTGLPQTHAAVADLVVGDLVGDI